MYIEENLNEIKSDIERELGKEKLDNILNEKLEEIEIMIKKLNLKKVGMTSKDIFENFIKSKVDLYKSEGFEEHDILFEIILYNLAYQDNLNINIE